MTALAVRPAGRGDLPAIHRIYGHHVMTGTASFEETVPDLAEMTRRFDALAAGGFPFLVAERRGGVLGYAYAGPFRSRSAYRYTVEDSIYLAPEACGQGIGGQLLDALMAGCAGGGFREVLAIIGDSANQASIALHRRHGFVMVGRFEAVGFKFGRWLDVVLMQRRLVP